MWILSLAKLMRGFDFFIASLLSSNGMSASITSVVKSIFFPAIHVGTVTLFNDFINFPLPNLNKVLISNSLTKLSHLEKVVLNNN